MFRVNLLVWHGSIDHIWYWWCPIDNILDNPLLSIIMNFLNWHQKLIIIHILVHLLWNRRKRSFYYPHLTSLIHKMLKEIYQILLRYYFWHLIQTIQIVKLSIYLPNWKPVRTQVHNKSLLIQILTNTRISSSWFNNKSLSYSF